MKKEKSKLDDFKVKTKKDRCSRCPKPIKPDENQDNEFAED